MFAPGEEAAFRRRTRLSRGARPAPGSKAKRKVASRFPAPRPLLSKARRERPGGNALFQLLVFGMQTHRPFEEELFLFAMIRIRNAALDGANGLTRLVVV